MSSRDELRDELSRALVLWDRDKTVEANLRPLLADLLGATEKVECPRSRCAYSFHGPTRAQQLVNHYATYHEDALADLASTYRRGYHVLVRQQGRWSWSARIEYPETDPETPAYQAWGWVFASRKRWVVRKATRRVRAHARKHAIRFVDLQLEVQGP